MARSSCVVRILGELGAGRVEDDGLEVLDHGLHALGIDVGVLAGADALLDGIEGGVHALAVDTLDDTAEELDEATVGIPAEALVVGELDDALQGLVVESEVEDGVHHARHGELGAGANAHEQRVLDIAEALAGLRLDLRRRRP